MALPSSAVAVPCGLGVSCIVVFVFACRAQNGELLETIDGVNTPLLKKFIADHLVDGIIDEDEVEAVGEGEDEED